MAIKQRSWVADRIATNLTTFMERDDAEQVALAVVDDVMTDIEETADEDFNTSDIDIALSRVIKNLVNEHYNLE